ncbi:hypothetical protein GCM10027167_37630 [Nocardia heshunensis]
MAVIAFVVWLAWPQGQSVRWVQVRTDPTDLTLLGPNAESQLSTADLDTFSFGRGIQPGSGLKYDRDGVDRASGYDNGKGHKTPADQAFGTSDRKVPTPGTCENDARTGGNGKTAVGRLQPGISAWCVLTPKGNLAWVHLISGGGAAVSATGPFPDLEFEEILWRPA